MWWFDMGGGWYDDPRMLSELKTDEQHRARESWTWTDAVWHKSPLSWMTMLAAICLHATLTAIRHSSGSFMKLGHMGAPFDIVHVSDLDRLPDYRLYVFPNLIAPREADHERVARKLARGGSVLWIGPAGLYRQGRVAPEEMENLTGFSLRFVESASAWRIIPRIPPSHGAGPTHALCLRWYSPHRASRR